MGLSAAREAVADAVAAALPSAVAVPYGISLDSIDVLTTVTVAARSLEPTVACPVARAGIDVYILAPIVEPGAVDVMLEDAADAVLAALRALPRSVISDGERLSLADRFPAFRIPVEVQL